MELIDVMKAYVAMQRSLGMRFMADVRPDAVVTFLHGTGTLEPVRFSVWDRIFKDPMTTMAAIARLVHYRVVLDLMGVDSYRPSVAKRTTSTSAKAAVIA